VIFPESALAEGGANEAQRLFPRLDCATLDNQAHSVQQSCEIGRAGVVNSGKQSTLLIRKQMPAQGGDAATYFRTSVVYRLE
jgi:hypothetical protein